MRYLAYIFWILIVILGISFASLNSSSVNINYYIGTVKLYVPLLLLIGLVIGALLGICAMLPLFFRMKCEVRKLRRQVKTAKHELTNLRTLPVRDDC